MAHYDVAGGELILRLSLLERLGGYVRDDAHIPLKAVRRARAVPSAWPELRGLRSPGVGWPRRVALGHWRFPGGKDFVVVYGRGPAVIVDVLGLDFARLVFTAPDAEAAAQEIELAATEAELGPAQA